MTRCPWSWKQEENFVNCYMWLKWPITRLQNHRRQGTLHFNPSRVSGQEACCSVNTLEFSRKNIRQPTEASATINELLKEALEGAGRHHYYSLNYNLVTHSVLEKVNRPAFQEASYIPVLDNFLSSLSSLWIWTCGANLLFWLLENGPRFNRNVTKNLNISRVFNLAKFL